MIKRIAVGMSSAVAAVVALLLNGAPIATAVSASPAPLYSAPVRKFSNPKAITNKYLPLASLKMDVLEGTEKGKTLQVERTIKDGSKTFMIGDQQVQALIMEDREFVSGELEEVTLDYFAQSDDGSVYYRGEDVDNYKNGKVVAHEGAWLYGKDTKVPGVVMPADPVVGLKFASESVPGITSEKDKIISASETVKVPAGTYTDCLKVRETTSDGKTEFKYHAPGVGVIVETMGKEKITLKSHETR